MLEVNKPILLLLILLVAPITTTDILFLSLATWKTLGFANIKQGNAGAN